MKPSSIIVGCLLVVLGGLGILYLRDTTAPSATLSRAAGPVSSRMELILTLKDQGSGLKEVVVSAQQGERRFQVLSRSFTPGVHEARETFRIAPQSGMKEGPFTLQVSVRDRSLYHLGSGNSTVLTGSYRYQNRPPAITVLSVAHNISRGGAALVVYSSNNDLERSGVVFADRFYPGYLQSGGVYACLFPFPYNLPAEGYIPRVIGVDRAGNERLAGIYFHLLPKRFPSDRIELTDGFLEKVAAEFRDRFPGAASPLEVFVKANSELRERDLQTLAECGRKTSPLPLWEGSFLRLPNAAPRGSFAQQRTYLYHGKEVDRQTHLGIDLASLPHAPVPAANRGRVVYADDLGIYGQCIIIDHGLGLQTLYGHLSRIGVKVGDQVAKGQIIGNTGDTGLAGGDHLHFGVLVSGEQVNPIEWWDPAWIDHNVTGKLEGARQLPVSP